MKLTSFILAASFAGNVALLAVVVVQRPAIPARPAPAAASTSSATASRSTTAETRATGVSLPSPPVTPSPPTWAQLASDDPRILARQLADAGFPRAMVRAIIEAQLDRRFADERRKLIGDDSSLPYWQARRAPANRDFGQRLSAIQTEHQTMLRDALGADYIVEDEIQLSWLRRLYGVSDPQKLVQLRAIVEDYQQVGNEMSRENPRSADREFAEESQRFLQRERLADIAALLTPEEFAAYELRAGNTAQGLRGSLRDFRASEQEFSALFAAYRAGEDPAAAASDRFNPNQLLERARAILTPERYADLQQAIAPGASKLNRLAARLNLPLSNVTPVDTAQRELKQRANTVRRDSTLTVEQRSAQLAAIAEEATTKITAALGERGFAAYRDYDGGWIGELTAPAVTRP